MPRGPVVTLFQLYSSPSAASAAFLKALSITKEFGPAGLVQAARRKLAHPSMPVEVLLNYPECELTFEERWVLHGKGLSRLHGTSIIILTKGNQNLVDACLRSLARSILADANVEIIVVSNAGSISSPSLYPFPLRLLRETRPFNWAAYNNNAADRARGEFLLFMNDDVQALHGGWLDAMLAEAVRPEVGVVGARLLYPSGLIQHHGIRVSRRGMLNFAHKFRPRDHHFERDEDLRPQEVDAVTGACLLTKRATFVKHLFEERFALNYNDVDYCLRVRQAGEKVTLAPHAELIHRETTTRSLRISRPDP